MKKKYLVVGGFVRSRNDGQIHSVSVPELIRLYGVHQDECVTFNPRSDPPSGLIQLRPRPNGDYADHIAKVRAL